MYKSTRQRRSTNTSTLLFFFIITFCVFVHLGRHHFKWSIFNISFGIQHQNQPTTALVVASRVQDDTTWLSNVLHDWDKTFYVTDDPNARYNVPANRGREAMAYLTYIIDNYDFLPRVAVFHHAARYQWHNDDPLYDGYRVLSRLQIPYVEEQGYVNLRCVWTLGCPSEIHPFVEDGALIRDSDLTRAGTFYKESFEELFPDLKVPEVVAASCCAQFAVSRERIRERPRSDYERYRKWLLETPLSDHISGRIMEYSWHIMFGQDAVFCPNAQECYCKVFGLCDLSCKDGAVCDSQYTLPRSSTLPQGWPDIGWDGHRQSVPQL